MKNNSNPGHPSTLVRLLRYLVGVIVSGLLWSLISKIPLWILGMPDNMKIQLSFVALSIICILSLYFILTPFILRNAPKLKLIIERRFPRLKEYNDQKYEFARNPTKFMLFLKRERALIAIYAVSWMISCFLLYALEATPYNKIIISIPLWSIMVIMYIRLLMYLFLRIGVYSWRPIKGRWHWLLRWGIIDNSRKKLTTEMIELMIAGR